MKGKRTSEYSIHRFRMLIRPRVLSHSLFACCNWLKQVQKVISSPYYSLRTRASRERERSVNAQKMYSCNLFADTVKVDLRFNAYFREHFWVSMLEHSSISAVKSGLCAA